MLRISYTSAESEQRWTLCGQLAGLWVAELRECWEHARRVADKQSLSPSNGRHSVVIPVIDLSDVTFIDESGERLLSEMRTSGAKFVAKGVANKHLLQNLKGRGERPMRRVITPRNACESISDGQKTQSENARNNNAGNGDKHGKSV